MIRKRTAKRFKAVTKMTKMRMHRIVDEVTLVVTYKEAGTEAPMVEEILQELLHPRK